MQRCPMFSPTANAEAPTVLRMGLTLSLVVVLILLSTGWKGWEMVYRNASAFLTARSSLC